ncbi:MAG: tetratricopeptide repeat protein [Bacteroidia bacterium]|nr:tetratricopeptide repeat protein [Bacteroidia bacterium]
MKTFKFLVTFFFAVFFTTVSAQIKTKAFSKEFYLCDSIPVNKMLPEERLILDSLLTIYNTQNNDTVQFKTLLQIPDLISDINIWPAYNTFLKEKVNSALKNLKNSEEQKLKTLNKIFIRTINNEGLLQMYMGNYSTASALYNQALEMAKTKKAPAEEAEVYNSIGGLYHLKGEMELTLKYYFLSMQLFTKIGDKESTALLLYNISQVYCLQQNLPMAIKYAQQSVKISEETENYFEAGTTYSLLGSILASIEEYEKSENYLKKAFKLSKRSGSKLLETEVLINLANLYASQNKIDLATKTYEAARLLAIETNNGFSLRIILANLAQKYNRIGNYPLALKYGNEALLLSKSFDNHILEVNAITILAEIYLNSKDYANARKFGEKAFSNSEHLKLTKEKMDAANILKQVYAHAGNWQKAFEMQNTAAFINDTINTNKNKKILYNKIYQIEYEKKELILLQEQKINNAIAAEEKKVAELELSRSRFIMLSLGVLLILTALLAILFIRQNKFKSMQRNIELEQKLLRSQMNPHFIFNSLNSIHSVVLSGDTKNATKYLASFSKLIRSILESSRFESISLEKEVALLNNYISLQILRFENNIKYNINIESGLYPETTMLPPMLTQPFIENALEHGLSNITDAYLTVNFKQAGGYLIIEVCDNGFGLGESKDSSMHISLATTITKERLELLNHKKAHKTIFSITEAFPESDNRKGVRVTFKIPLQNT